MRRLNGRLMMILALFLTACGTATPTPVPTATIAPAPTRSAPAPATPTSVPSPAVSPSSPTAPTAAVTAAPATPLAPLTATRQTVPDRTPDMATGARSDGWVLDRIETSESGGRVALTLRFEPLPGQSGGPQAEAWFESSDNTYSIVVHGVRGSNLVLRPGEVMPLGVAPLRGYYALPVRDDTIFALVIVAARPSATWSLTANDAPGVLRLMLG